MGLEYKSEEGHGAFVCVTWQFTLKQATVSPASAKGSQFFGCQSLRKVRVKGSSLDFGRDSRFIAAIRAGPGGRGPGAERLTAGENQSVPR